MIAQEDYDFITAYELTRTKQDRDALLDSNKMQCARTMINFVTTVAKDQNVRYILTLLDDMIMVSVPLFHLFFHALPKDYQLFLSLCNFMVIFFSSHPVVIDQLI